MATLYSKLAAVLLGIFCLVGMLFLAIAYFSMQMYRQEVTQRLNHDLARHIAAEKLLIRGKTVNRAALEDIFHQIMAVNPSIEIYLLDAGGRILAFSAAPGKVKLRSVNLAPVHAFLHVANGPPILGQDPRSANGEKIFSAARIPERGPTDGYLYVILGGEQYESVAQLVQAGYIPRLSLFAIAVSLMFALLAGLLLFALLTRRLTGLTASVENLQRNNFIPPVAPRRIIGRGDEIDRLTAAFHHMAGHIAEQMNKLKVTDQLRRELVANVSHDLRTPLACMQGYLETLIRKHGQLTRTEQRQYLEIARNHSVRLGRLVGELFDLAKLDSGDAQAHPEPFLIAELLQDVTQEFQLFAQQRGIALETSLQDKDLFVTADIGMIERVLVNLIDNALRYTPEGGQVYLRLWSHGDRACIQVADTGCGIPAQDLTRVFDRFYRAEQARRSETDGTGLGLAIAKRILELHGSAITVESTPNAGTTFAFHLPASVPGPRYDRAASAA